MNIPADVIFSLIPIFILLAIIGCVLKITWFSKPVKTTKHISKMVVTKKPLVRTKRTPKSNWKDKITEADFEDDLSQLEKSYLFAYDYDATVIHFNNDDN